jgi:hypothetical protein
MSNKPTSRDLLGTLIDLEQDLELSTETEDSIDIQSKITEVKRMISRKVESIDYFSVEMERRTGLIDAELDTYRKEIKRLMSQKNAIKRTEDYMNKVMLPMIIETAGNDGVLKTDTARYKLYETYGPLEVDDEDEVPNEYRRVKIEIDKRAARPAVIEAKENGMGISGFSIEKIKRVRRS